MAPIYDTTTFMYNYVEENPDEYDDNKSEDIKPDSVSEMVFWYMVVFICMLLTWLLIYFCLRIMSLSKYYLLF